MKKRSLLIAFLSLILTFSVSIGLTTSIAYAEETPVEYSMGDANLDGKVNTRDAVYIKQSVVGLVELTERQKIFSDVNGDGNINTRDAVLIQQSIVGMDVDLGVHEHTFENGVCICGYEKEGFRVVWENYDGTVLKTLELENIESIPSYDGEMPTREKDAQYTYTFSGWREKTTTNRVVYTAQYSTTINKYTVIWKNHDGAVLETETEVPYGTIPTYNGNTPVKEKDAQYTYTFNSWDKTITAVVGDITYTAIYTNLVNKYTVTWKDYDGTVLELDESVGYGKTPSFDRENPTREKDAQYTYTFSGWNPTVDSVTGNVVYTAQYSTTINKYTVTWKNFDGTVLETDAEVPYGEIPIYNSNTPTKDKDARYTYTFDSWSPVISSVVGDVVYTAQFINMINKYTITLVFNNGNDNEKVEFDYQEDIVIDIPTWNRKSFVGWYEDENLTIAHSYEKMPNKNYMLYAKWETYDIVLSYDETKTAISINDEINAVLFGATAIDTDETILDANVEVIAGQLQVGETITVRLTATGLYNVKAVKTITDVHVYGAPTLTCYTTKDYINVSDELVGNLFSAIGTDTFGGNTDIVVAVKEGEYSAGDIVTIVVTAIDVAGNEFTVEIPNVKAYGAPIINRDETIVDMKVSEIVSNEKFVVTATDSFGVPLEVTTEIINGTFAEGHTITVRSLATDTKGNVGYDDYEIKVYGLPTISTATTKDFKVEDEITLDTLGVVVKDSFGVKLKNVTLTLQNGSQTAGSILTYLVVAVDHVGNENSLVVDNVRIFGAPEITCEKDKLKVEKAYDNVTVSFDLNGGSGAIASQIITNTKGLVYPSIPTKSGYVFSGWYDNANCTGTPFDFSANLDGDITLYAKWVTKNGSYFNVVEAGPELYIGQMSYDDVCTHFICYAAGSYKINFSLKPGADSISLDVINVTTGKLIDGVSLNALRNNKSDSVWVDAKAGDIIQIRSLGSNSAPSIYGNPNGAYYYVTGAKYPEAGGLYAITLQDKLGVSAKDSFGNGLDVSVELTSGNIAGGNVIYYTFTTTDLVGNQTIVTMPVKLYDVQDIAIDFNKYATDLIKLGSCGEEFFATAIDSFGDSITIQIIAVDGELTAGATESIRLVAVDAVGNVKESEVISNIKIYSLPTITYKYDGDYIDVSDNPYALFDVRDSFGEELSFDIEVVEGEKILGQKITYKVTATDISGNVIEEVYTLDVVEKGKVGITLDVNGGNSIENSFILVLQNESFELQIPTRTGYKFIGWSFEGVFYTDENGNSVKTFDETFNIATLTANWEVVTYTITYELDGGTTINTAEYTIESETIVLSNPTKAHYDFVEWQLDGEKTTEIAKGCYGNKTLVAVWNAEIYTITYKLNGGVNNSSNVAEYTVESETITLLNPTKAHYDFIEWQLNGKKITEIVSGSYGDIGLEAIFTPTVYTIACELKGGSVVNETTYTIESEDVILNNPTKTGYNFLGWSGTDIEGTSTNVVISCGSMGNREYTANWEAITYTITYELNGGSATNENTYTIENERVELNNPSKTGYTFLGWSGTDIVGMSTNVVIPSGSTGNKTYTANWEVSTYTITYQLNGGTNNSNNVEQYTIESETIVLLEPVKEHCTFVEWQLDGEKITEIAKGSYENKTLVAIWDAEIYTITYILNGGENATRNPVEYTVESDTITLLNPTKAHYDFVEWQLNGKKITEIVSGSYGDIELVAIFTPTVYTIACELKGGSAVNETTYTIESENIILNNPTKTGYAFLGWSGTAIEGMSANVVISSGSTGNREYTANWVAAVYNITCELNGGSATNENTYTIESENIVLNNPTKTGYTFLGWSGPDIVAISTNVVIPSGSIGNRTYTANWQVIIYTITYELDGGSTANVAEYTIESETIVLSNPTKDYYDFVEWQLDGKKVTEITSGSIGDKTIVAVWTPTVYSIDYESNGGVNDDVNVDKYTIESETIVLSNPTKEHYDFVEWQLDGKKVTEITSGSYGDKRLVAIWTPTVYTIKYVLGIDVENNNPTSYHIETSSFTLTTPTSKSYQFLGWYLENDYKTQVKEIIEGSSDNLVLYAKWRTIFTLSGYNVSGLTSYGKTMKEIVVPSIIDGKEIIGIGDRAFSNCSSLMSVVIAEGITSIGNYAFYYCTSLEEINMPNNVTSIGNYALYNCDLLTNLIIPDCVESIGEKAFYSCENLTISCKIATKPEGWITNWNEVGYNTYAPVVWDCLNNDVAEDGFVYIVVDNLRYKLKDEQATFVGEVQITKEVVIPNCISYKNVFYSVTSIDSSVFYGQDSLSKVVIPNTVISLGYNIFDGCNSLIIYCEHSNQPTDWLYNWNQVDTGIFAPVVWDCKNNDVADDGCIYVNDNGIVYGLKDGVATINALPKNIVSLNISSKITYKGVVYSIEKIANGALKNCSEIAYISVDGNSNSFKSIGGNLYSYDGKTLIKYAVSSADTKFMIPNGVTHIDEYAFYNCRNLTEVIIPNSVTSIGSFAFARCDSLTSIVIPDSVTSIGSFAFFYCKALSTIEIPDSVTSIGEYAFDGCSGLMAVFLGNNIEYIGNNAIPYIYDMKVYCSETSKPEGWDKNWHGYGTADSVVWGFEQLYVDEQGVEYALLQDKTAIVVGFSGDTETIFLGGINGYTVLEIAQKAFSLNRNISSITIGEGVEIINSFAFSHCTSLTNIVISSSVTKVDSYAFSNSSSLQAIYFMGREEDWAKITIVDSNNEYFIEAPRYYYVENELDLPNDSGNYWHYDENGEIAIW